MTPGARVERVTVGVALDERGGATPGTRIAVDKAEQLAEAIAPAVELLHVAEWWSGGATSVDESERLRAARRSIDQFARRFEHVQVNTSTVILGGTPADALSRASTHRSSDLVVVGRHDDDVTVRPARSPAPLGATARATLFECAAPLWIVRPGPATSRRVVLAATDVDDVAARVLAWAALFAEALAAELHVLHVQRAGDGAPTRSSAAAGEPVDHAGREAIDQRLAEAGVDQDRAHRHFTHGPPLRALRERVSLLRPELLVLGSVSRSGVPGLVVGNTAQRVLDEIDCSLLMLKPEGVEKRLARRISVA